MLRYGGLRQWQLVDNITTNTGIFTYEQPQDLYPGGMTNCFAQQGKLFVGFWPFNWTQIRLLIRRWAADLTDQWRRLHRKTTIASNRSAVKSRLDARLHLGPCDRSFRCQGQSTLWLSGIPNASSYSGSGIQVWRTVGHCRCTSRHGQR